MGLALVKSRGAAADDAFVNPWAEGSFGGGKERSSRATQEEETDAVFEHNGGEAERGALPEELVERKTGSSDVVEKKEEQSWNVNIEKTPTKRSCFRGF